MSHVTHTGVGTRQRMRLSAQLRAHRLVALVAMLAAVATAAVVLALTLGDDSSPVSSTDQPQPQPAVRADRGPEESAVADAIGSQPPAARPDESAVAAAIGSGGQASPAPARPDESAVAAAISGR